MLYLTGRSAVCGPAAGCSKVLSSVYAAVGVPTTSFGMLGYFVVFRAAVCLAFGYAKARTVLHGVVAVMFLATLGFLYLQAFVVHAFCPFCLLSAALTFPAGTALESFRVGSGFVLVFGRLSLAARGLGTSRKVRFGKMTNL